MKSAIYTGRVVHNRRRPKRHKLSYRVFSLLIDLDEREALKSKLRLLRFDRGGVLSFRQSDHGEGASSGLREWVDQRLAEAGIDIAGGRVALLAYPRMFGYAFNPLSIYFCRDDSDRVTTIIYEVHNTFGERHSYLIEAETDQSGIIRQTTEKAFYVSPFMDMSMQYAFRVRPPGDSVSVDISGTKHGDRIIFAALAGNRGPLTTSNLLRHCLALPLMTLKVMGAIHFEALRIWLRARPAA